MIVCRKCSRRHADGTDFCACGAFLEFDGERVADDPPAPGTTTPGAVAPPAPPGHPPTPPAGPPARGPEWGSPPAPRQEPAPWSGFSSDQPPAEPSSWGSVQAQLPDTPIAPSTADPVDVRPTARLGDVTCGRCGTPNPPVRQFCQHCGQELSKLPETAQAAASADGGRPSWWRRVSTRVRRRVPTDPSRIAAEAHRMSRGGMSYRTVAFRSGGLAIVLGGLLAFLGPWRQPVIAFAKDRLGVSRYELIDVDPEQVATARAEPATEPVVFPLQEAEKVVDRHLNTSWATRWLDPFDPGLDTPPDDRSCQSIERTDSVLRVSFPEPTDLAQVSVVPGRYDGDDTRGTFFRPQLLELRWAGDRCQYLVLQDTGELSVHGFDHDDITDIEIRVVGVYADTESDAVVDISEIVFERTR